MYQNKDGRLWPALSKLIRERVEVTIPPTGLLNLLISMGSGSEASSLTKSGRRSVRVSIGCRSTVWMDRCIKLRSVKLTLIFRTRDDKSLKHYGGPAAKELSTRTLGHWSWQQRITTDPTARSTMGENWFDFGFLESMEPFSLLSTYALARGVDSHRANRCSKPVKLHTARISSDGTFICWENSSSPSTVCRMVAVPGW